MPPYNTSPLAAPVVQLQPSVAEYLLGRRNQYQADTRFALTGVVDNGTNAVYSGTVVEGNIPTVGALFTAQTENPAYNALNAKVNGTTIASNGVGTITIPSQAAGTAAFGGYAVVPVPEIPETLVNGTSIAAAVPFNGSSAISRKLMAEVTFPTIPTAATVSIQGAIRNIDSEYVTLGQVGTVTGGAVTLSQIYLDAQGMYYRFIVSGVSGTGTICAKVVV